MPQYPWGIPSLGALTVTFADNIEEGKGSLETVRTGAFSVPAGAAGDYFTLMLDTPFLYNGVDNLVVDFLVTACDAVAILMRDSTTLSNGALWVGSLTSTTGGLWTTVLHTKFNFEGGDNAVEFADPPINGNGYPFASRNKVQLLYTAALIDGSGPITGVAMRIGYNATTDASYTYTMRLGHSTLTDLSTDFNANFSDTPVTVADLAVLTVPAGINPGDYVWIPMPDGLFNYNGSDNLIVEIDVSAGTGAANWGAQRPCEWLPEPRLWRLGQRYGYRHGQSAIPHLLPL